MKRDPRIDAHIAKAAPFAQPILNHLRALVHEAVEGTEETIKWGMPHFTLAGKNFAGMAAFKAHASFTIHGEAEANQERERQEGAGHFGRLTSLDDLPGDNFLKSRIVAAVERIQNEGTALGRRPAAMRGPKPELPIPPEFAAALATNLAAKAALETFAPSQRREYVEWIIEAKRPETRDKRIAQAVAQLVEGKKRNWQYQDC